MSKTHKNKLVFLTGNIGIPGHIQDFKELLNDEDYNLDFKTYSDIYPGEPWDHVKQCKIIDECEFIIILGEECSEDDSAITIGKGNFELINNLPIGKKCYITSVGELDWYKKNNLSYCTVHPIMPCDDSMTVLGSDYKKWVNIDRSQLEDIDLDCLFNDFQESFDASLVKSSDFYDRAREPEEDGTQDNYVDAEDIFDWAIEEDNNPKEKVPITSELSETVKILSESVKDRSMTPYEIEEPTTSYDAKSSNFDNSNGIKGVNFLELKTGKGGKPFTGLSNVNFIKLKKRIF